MKKEWLESQIELGRNLKIAVRAYQLGIGTAYCKKAYFPKDCDVEEFWVDLGWKLVCEDVKVRNSHIREVMRKVHGFVPSVEQSTKIQ